MAVAQDWVGRKPRLGQDINLDILTSELACSLAGSHSALLCWSCQTQPRLTSQPSHAAPKTSQLSWQAPAALLDIFLKQQNIFIQNKSSEAHMS